MMTNRRLPRPMRPGRAALVSLGVAAGLVGLLLLAGCAATTIPSARSLVHDTRARRCIVLPTAANTALVFVCTHGAYIVAPVDLAKPEDDLTITRISDGATRISRERDQ